VITTSDLLKALAERELSQEWYLGSLRLWEARRRVNCREGKYRLNTRNDNATIQSSSTFLITAHKHVNYPVFIRHLKTYQKSLQFSSSLYIFPKQKYSRTIKTGRQACSLFGGLVLPYQSCFFPNRLATTSNALNFTSCSLCVLFMVCISRSEIRAMKLLAQTYKNTIVWHLKSSETLCAEEKGGGLVGRGRTLSCWVRERRKYWRFLPGCFRITNMATSVKIPTNTPANPSERAILSLIVTATCLVW